MKNIHSHHSLILPNWRADPQEVTAFMTTRTPIFDNQIGELSNNRFDSFNLSYDVGDDQQEVRLNREHLSEFLPMEPMWLRQIHGNQCIMASHVDRGISEADAFTSLRTNEVCAIMTADCMPILLYEPTQKSVAAVHASWRSLARGILENTLHAMRAKTQTTLAWLGPAIGPSVFEVGKEVLDEFCYINSKNTSAFQIKNAPTKFLANLYSLAENELKRLGLLEENISKTELCTYTNHQRFYSYRRCNNTGRMATVIWRNKIPG